MSGDTASVGGSWDGAADLRGVPNSQGGGTKAVLGEGDSKKEYGPRGSDGGGRSGRSCSP